LLLAWAACLLVRAAWRQIRAAQAPESRMQGVALLYVLTAVLVIGLFDPVLQLPQAMFLVAVLGGALAPARGATGKVSLGRRTHGLAVALVAALSLAAALQSGRRMGAAHLVGSWSRPHTSPHRLEGAIRIDPANYEAHVLLGAFWIRQGRCDLALPPLRQAARLFPTASPIPELRAHCWHADPDTEDPAVVGASS
jgi:cytochrome c-type biogenesis protein CcmH/NrfG